MVLVGLLGGRIKRSLLVSNAVRLEPRIKLNFSPLKSRMSKHDRPQLCNGKGKLFCKEEIMGGGFIFCSLKLLG